MDSPSRYKVAKIGRMPGDVDKRSLIDLVGKGRKMKDSEGKVYRASRTPIVKALLKPGERARLKERFKTYIDNEMT
jgi:hypothetical protein